MNIFLFFLLAGTGHGLKLTLSVEREEYMAGPLSGLGVLVSMFKNIDMDTTWTVSFPYFIPCAKCIESLNLSFIMKSLLMFKTK